MAEILDYNPLTGERVLFDYEASADRMILKHEQDVDTILELNKVQAMDTDQQRKQIKKDLVRYARIPNTVIIKWKQELGVDLFNPNHKAKVFQLLNDPEWKYLKTVQFRHE